MELIRLTENDLKNIVGDSVNNILSDFLPTKRHASFDNPISRSMRLPLSEGLIKTYPLEKTISYIKAYFNLSDDDIYPLHAENGREQIAIKVPIVGNNLELVKKAFALCGYYLGYPKDENIQSNKIYELQFEKKYDDDFSKELKEHETTLYHVTPIYYAEKIKRIGITPRSRNKEFGYPDRSYFVIGSARPILPYLVWELYASAENKLHNGKYAAFSIGLNKVPKEMRFYLDPNSKYSVYTYENIAPNAIIGVEEISVS